VITEHTEELASLYVLGLLPPDEARWFEADIAADAEVAALVARLEAGAAAIAAAIPPRDPPPALRGRIMSQIRSEEPASASVPPSLGSRTVRLPWAIAACLALLVGGLAYERYHLKLLVDSFLLRDVAQQRELDRVQTRDTDLQQQLDAALAHNTALASQTAGLQSQLDAMRGEVAALHARDALSQIKIATLASLSRDIPQAVAVVAWDGDTQRGILRTSKVPAARADQDYQLWIIDPGYKQPVSAGIFDPGKEAHFQPVQSISKAEKFAISLEKKGGSAAPQGPIVLVGE